MQVVQYSEHFIQLSCLRTVGWNREDLTAVAEPEIYLRYTRQNVNSTAFAGSLRIS